ncbi:hypothetical protein [Mesobacillus harenae]|uniref:hypothetical protein n=1 Tax=Mesobacillus harenae TaxID=2213203 RepID=UPI001580BFE4|nr:hypothetical protein [Mesobacillus harenae]
MSDKKKKIIHVDNLIIHAKKVEIIDDSREDAKVEVKEDPIARRDPWGFFWGRQQRDIEYEQPEAIEDSVDH